MQLRIIRSFQNFVTGEIREIPDGAANVLISRGIAEATEMCGMELAAVSVPENAISRRKKPKPPRKAAKRKIKA